jgi:hypothetical protein
MVAVKYLLIFLAFSTSQQLNSLEMIQPLVEVDAESETKQFSRDWEALSGFSPEQMMTVDLPAGADCEFFEKIEVVPGKIQGAWFLASENAENIDFFVKDPSGRVLFKKLNNKEAVFDVEVKVLGVYSLVFLNRKIMGTQPITFTFSTDSSEGLLKGEHLTPVEEKILKVDRAVKDFQVDNQFAQLRQETHFQTVSSANRNVFWLSLAESLGVLAVTAWQIYYIKKLLDNRRVL